MEKERKTKIVRIVLRAVILLILAVIILFVLENYENIRAENLPGWLAQMFAEAKQEVEKISFAPDSTNIFRQYRGGLAVLNATELVIYDASGEESLAKSTGYTRPAMKSAGDYLLIYDIGGSEYHYIRKNEIISSVKHTSAVLTADINDNGWFLITGEEFGTKAAVTVYDDKMTEVYKWPSSERYITCAALSGDNSRIAFGGVNQRDARIRSSVVMLRIDSTQPYSVIEFDDVLVLDMKFLTDGSLAVLTENCILVADASGRERGRYEFDSALFRDYSFDGDGFIALRLSRSGSGEASEVLILDYDAKVAGTVVLNNIFSLSCSGKSAGVLTSDHIIVYNSSLEEQFRSSISAGSKKLLMREDGSAIVLSSAEALIYR